MAEETIDSKNNQDLNRFADAYVKACLRKFARDIRKSPTIPEQNVTSTNVASGSKLKEYLKQTNTTLRLVRLEFGLIPLNNGPGGFGLLLAETENETYISNRQDDLLSIPWSLQWTDTDSGKSSAAFKDLELVGKKASFAEDDDIILAFRTNENVYYLTTDPYIFLSESISTRVSGIPITVYNLVRLESQTQIPTDTLKTSITPLIKISLIRQDIQWLQRCALRNSEIGADTLDFVCLPLFSPDVRGQPNEYCDTVAQAYCNDPWNSSSDACACFGPAVSNDDSDTLLSQFLDFNYPGAQPGPLCLLARCRDIAAYKTTEQLNTECPYLCTSILNVNAQDRSDVVLLDSSISVRCGDGSQAYDLSVSGTVPSIKDTRTTRDQNTAFLIVVLVLLLISSAILSSIWLYHRPKRSTNKTNDHL